MDERLRRILVRHQLLKSDASNIEAYAVYDRLSLEEKGKIGVELAKESFEHANGEPLTVREFPADLTVRQFAVDPQTVNDDARTIDGVISTEAAVTVYDWRSGELIDEVLLVNGARYGDRLPLLDNHDRWSTQSVLGSARGFRQEADAGAGHAGTVAQLAFVRDDPDVERIWNKVRQGHLRDLSVGYAVDTAVEIQPGQSAAVAGRTYTAGKRRMRVATQWTAREVSVTPIGADQLAKMRSQGPLDKQPHNHSKEKSAMPPELRKYLESIGLRTDASEADAQTFYEAHRAQADAAVKPATPPAAPVAPPAGEGTRTAPPPAPPAAPDPVAAERDRVRQIEELAGDDVPQAMRRQAIADGWPTERASREFLSAVRAQRTPVPYQPTAAGNVPTGDGSVSARTLAAAMMLSYGTATPLGRILHDGRSNPSAANRLTEQDLTAADRFRRLSAVDMVRAAVQLDTGRFYWDAEEALRAAAIASRTAPSGGTLSYVFTTNVYARLMAAWERIGDTTAGWCDEEDVPNFLSQEEISVAASARLDQHPRGGTANHATFSDSHETYKIGRYSKQFVMEDMDIIDDRFGAHLRVVDEMGEAARALRPDLVYSVMLENPTMADTGAVFNATAVTTAGGHANLGTGALASGSLKTAITAMVAQRINRTADDPGQALTIRPRFLIVPGDLEWTARELTASAMLAKLFADSADPWYSQLNLLAQEGLRVVVDNRLDAVGVMDPRDKTVRTGTATNWFLTQGGNRGLRVAYRRGTNRSPQMRSFTLDKGQWGLGWDINMDIGVKFLEYRTWYKSTGAS